MTICVALTVSPVFMPYLFLCLWYKYAVQMNTGQEGQEKQ